MLKKWGSKYDDVSGKFEKNIIKKLSKSYPETIEQFKLALLSLLHNKGNDNFFKNYSPFLSFSRGFFKYSYSKKFATNNNENGLIYVYILNKQYNNYLYGSELKKILKKFGINWFSDIHSEVMLLNGMYPHYLLGFFEVSKKRYLRFILNPWFYEIFLEKENFDFSQGVPVNQQNFGDFANKLGYASYVYHYKGSSDEYLSNLEKLDQRQVQRLRNIKRYTTN